MTKLTDLTLTEARAALDKGDFSAREFTEEYIKAQDYGRPLNAMITETFEVARRQAAEADQRHAEGKAGLMNGIPIVVKDLFCTREARTTAASKILEHFKPPYESTVTGKLWDAGAVMLGKANLDEFALGSAGVLSAYGPTISPWTGAEPDKATRKIVPGGTSSGSAAAVAAHIAVAATGTDTGGSVRQPASFCGIVGVKPTYGRCSRYGIIAAASSLDQAGAMTRTISDAALMLRVMSGYDPKDSTSIDRPVPDFTASLGKSVKGLKIGIPREYRVDGINQETAAMWDRAAAMLRDAGAEIVDITLPHTKYALPTYYIINPAEVSSNLSRYDGVRYGERVNGNSLPEMYANTRAAGLGPEAKRRIMVGTYALSAGYYDAYYRQAQRARRLIRQDFLDAFSTCDVMLTPIAPHTAFAIGEKQDDPIQMYLEDIFSITLNLAGLPGIVQPIGLAGNGLPIGLQLIGRPFDEATMFTAASALEKAASFKARPAFTA